MSDEMRNTGRAPARTADEWVDELAARRRMSAMQGLTEAIADSEYLAVPAPVERVVVRPQGVPPKLPAEAFELARQVYYLQHGTLTDAARAVIAAGLADVDDVTVIRDRLTSWWMRERWPKRRLVSTFAIRDAGADGGLFRSRRLCCDVATGNGPAPKGKRCSQSALTDSEYCFHHDPRPEFVAKRRAQTEALTAGRLRAMVPLAPFRDWCDEQRKLLLEQERRVRPVHPNATGWGLLAAAMGVDQSLLGRLIAGKHSPGRPAVTRIKARTVESYLEQLGVAFVDVYGYERPHVAGDPAATCSCGAAKNHGSKTCRDCYDAAFKRCSYVFGSGAGCNVKTDHESGMCAKCRRTVQSVRRPRTGRPTALTAAMLQLALSEYRDVPVAAWVGRRMWEDDAAGVRSAFKTQKSLTGSLVKHFRRHGWNDAAAAELAYAELVARDGLEPWPTSGLAAAA